MLLRRYHKKQVVAAPKEELKEAPKKQPVKKKTENESK